MQRRLAGLCKAPPMVYVLFGLFAVAQALAVIAKYPGAARYGGWYVEVAFLAFFVLVLTAGIAGLREQRSAPPRR